MYQSTYVYIKSVSLKVSHHIKYKMSFKRPLTLKPPYVPLDYEPEVPNITDSYVTEIVANMYKMKPINIYDRDPMLYMNTFHRTRCYPHSTKPLEPKGVTYEPNQIAFEKQADIKHDISKMNDLNEKYWKKGKRPPYIEVLRAMTAAGYTDEDLNKVMDRVKWWRNNEDYVGKEIERIWPGSTKRVKKTEKMLVAVKKI
jgi:hypothetical protein